MYHQEQFIFKNSPTGLRSIRESVVLALIARWAQENGKCKAAIERLFLFKDMLLCFDVQKGDTHTIPSYIKFDCEHQPGISLGSIKLCLGGRINGAWSAEKILFHFGKRIGRRRQALPWNSLQDHWGTWIKRFPGLCAKKWISITR